MATQDINWKMVVLMAGVLISVIILCWGCAGTSVGWGLLEIAPDAPTTPPAKLGGTSELDEKVPIGTLLTLGVLGLLSAGVVGYSKVTRPLAPIVFGGFVAVGCVLFLGAFWKDMLLGLIVIALAVTGYLYLKWRGFSFNLVDATQKARDKDKEFKTVHTIKMDAEMDSVDKKTVGYVKDRINGNG